LQDAGTRARRHRRRRRRDTVLVNARDDARRHTRQLASVNRAHWSFLVIDPKISDQRVNLSGSLETFCKSSGLMNGPSSVSRSGKLFWTFLEKLQLFEFIDRAFSEALDLDKRPKRQRSLVRFFLITIALLNRFKRDAAHGAGASRGY
jgi:hypothetical protein